VVKGASLMAGVPFYRVRRGGEEASEDLQWPAVGAL
jgi:hypothetical protein